MHANLEQLQRVLTYAIGSMSPEEMTAHPEGKWNAAQILEHLNLTYTGTIKNLERCLAAGKPGASADRRAKRWQRLIITHLGYYPSGRQAPERARPRGAAAEQVTGEIMDNLRRMDEIIGQCESRFPAREPIADHPILGPLTAAEWRNFHFVHGTHHVRQIRKLRGN